jgi:hypothetical protein
MASQDLRSPIRRAHSCAVDTRQAAREFHAAVVQPEMALVVFFCSIEHDLDTLAGEMKRLFAGVQVVGCTTAGEIGPAGYRERSLSGASFAASDFSAVSARLDGLRAFDSAAGHTFAQHLLQQLESRAPQAGADNSFAFMLIDGLARREEPVARAVQSALGPLPLVGGSAGDGMRFERTFVYADGRFAGDSAVVALVSTVLPFRLFKTQHFEATEQRLVVTQADVARRSVTEIDGLPAAEAYARLLGVDRNQLDPRRFAARPMVVKIGDANYVRAIQQADADGRLTFFCAIEEGLVLRVGQSVDLLRDLEQALGRIRAEIGPPQIVLACDCFLRKLEIVHGPSEGPVRELLLRNNAVGFNTYGEQFRGLHVNQTLVGIAIGGGRKEGTDG